MLSALRDFFDAVRLPGGAAAQADQQRELRLAAAVLLVEVMRAEPGVGEPERRVVVDALRSEFMLGDNEVQSLLQRALLTSREATDYYEFTSRINEGFDLPRKLRMIEHMWGVVYADGQLGAYENHVMRKLADLLYIPQGAYINAKMRAQRARPAHDADVEPGPALPTG
jgi:uncharacterized tellurite resistance protein B-like protein